MKKTKNIQKKQLAVSVIVTVLNEVGSVDSLIKALTAQSYLPREVIVVDGGSTDGTWDKLQQLARKSKKISLVVEQKRGNRSVGRNRAVELAESPWIAITDAGCEPDRDWLAELVGSVKSQIEIVSGYFYPLAKTGLEQAFSCYALAMPRVIKDNFMLPTTRSMLIKKSVLTKLGGFDQSLSDNEDYALARKMLRANLREKIVFTPRARVGWIPHRSWSEFIRTIYRFARGDAYAGLWRPKVLLIFGRYLFALTLFLIFLFTNYFSYLLVLIVLAIIYLLWSIAKNYRYAPLGWPFLPILQLVADAVVMIGTIIGLSSRLCASYFK
ncbi:MAG TPA: glycosyltransferase [Candidatus Woesebacteria bacterium]|nr:glycosyltransferase [Candidatus Woesebacteria bacterium]